MVGNEKYCPTSGKEGRATLNIRKTEKNKGKIFIVKMNIFLEKGKVKVNLIKIKLIIDMLYVVYIQFKFSNLVLKSCWQLKFLTTFLYRC